MTGTLASVELDTAEGNEGEGAVAVARPVDRFRPGLSFYLAAGWIVVLVLVSLLAGVLPLDDPLQPAPQHAAAPPSWDHWFGTDTLGRDLFSRVIFGARVSLMVAFASVAIAAVIGSALGLIAGYVGKRVEGFIMGALDTLLAFPALVLALALAVFLGAGGRNVVIAVAFVAIPVFGRLARAQTLSVGKQDFVLVSRSTGASRTRTLVTEIVPNVAPSIFSFALVFAAIAIVIEGGLSFLGLGVPPPKPAWGAIIASGQPKLDQAPHISIVPSILMFVTVLALNTVGEQLKARFADASGTRT